MNALRNQVRPKHQVLVLKCYPRHQKYNVELKPNSSELSYLLYYASTRRSKLQKVGDFLEKRAASDVWNVRIGNVQVTLHILKALIEKCSRDLPLFAAQFLRILKTILKSLDVTMIEETLPAWATFCSHLDPAVLAADQDYISQYIEIVHLYTSFASKDNPVQHKSAKSLPVRIRYRKAGLTGIKSIAESDALTAESGRQLSITVPVILENIYSEDGSYLSALEKLEEERHEIVKELAIKRRQSTSTVAPAENVAPDPVAAAGSTEVADRLAERETAAIALQALKKIFLSVPPGQLRLAVNEILKFIGTRIQQDVHFPSGTVIPLQSGSWPCVLYSMICSWAAVQDRHVILVTTVDELAKSPAKEEDYERQYVLATIAGWLLSSDINFIGLSVMDVLVRIVHHILVLLQSGDPAVVLKENAGLSADHSFDANSGSSAAPSQRAKLVSQLQRCIGCLAVHVYYSEQVSDMIAALLSRVKQSTPNTPANGEVTDSHGSSPSLVDKRQIEGYFTTTVEKLAALRAIKEIIVWANWIRADGLSKRATRNPVRVNRWEDSEWLLADSSWEVRVAYTDVLLTWLLREVQRSELVVKDPVSKKHRSERRDGSNRESSLARRAVSNASQRDLSSKRQTSTFLPLLHVVIYDNAHQYGGSERDVALLHLLLYSLVAKLGVNSVEHGLPMIKKLQSDITQMTNPETQIQVASLVYGYLWALSSHFSFDASATGRHIALEVSQRMQQNLWLTSIRVPPMILEEVARKAASSDPGLIVDYAESLNLSPFTKFDTLRDKISEGYEVTLRSPPNSPPASPNRKISAPILDSAAMLSPNAPNKELPGSAREALVSDWDRDAVLAANAKPNGSRTGSLSGSQHANSSGKHLALVLPTSGLNGEGQMSPRRSQAHHNSLHVPHTRGSRPGSAYHGYRDSAIQPHLLKDSFQVLPSSNPRSRRTSQAGTPISATSSVRSSVRVEDLKRVLSGQAPMPPPTADINDEAEPDDSASESLVSYEGSEISTAPPQIVMDSAPSHEPHQPSHARTGSKASSQGNITEGSVTPRPRTSSSSFSPRPTSPVRRSSISSDGDDFEEIPPVPPLPQGYAALSRPQTANSQPIATAVPLSPTRPTVLASRSPAADPLPGKKTESIRSQNVRDSLRRSISTRDGAVSSRQQTAADAPKGAWSALDLLDSIESDAVGPMPGTGAAKGGRLKPPY